MFVNTQSKYSMVSTLPQLTEVFLFICVLLVFNFVLLLFLFVDISVVFQSVLLRLGKLLVFDQNIGLLLNSLTIDTLQSRKLALRDPSLCYFLNVLPQSQYVQDTERIHTCIYGSQFMESHKQSHCSFISCHHSLQFLYPYPWKTWIPVPTCRLNFCFLPPFLTHIQNSASKISDIQHLAKPVVDPLTSFQFKLREES